MGCVSVNTTIVIADDREKNTLNKCNEFILNKCLLGKQKTIKVTQQKVKLRRSNVFE